VEDDRGRDDGRRDEGGINDGGIDDPVEVEDARQVEDNAEDAAANVVSSEK